MATHGPGSGHGKRHAPPPKVTRRPAHKPRPTVIPPTPADPKAPDALKAGVELLRAAAALLDVLHRMPWCRDHRPDCPAASAGPCTCGSGDLVAAMAHVRVALDG